MKLVMFDVDGTLTETVEADEECFVQALLDVFGFTDVDTDWASYPYCSDSGVLETLFSKAAWALTIRSRGGQFSKSFPISAKPNSRRSPI